jgi:hypothetical protein
MKNIKTYDNFLNENKSKKDISMYFAYGDNKVSDKFPDTTFEAILAGLRTSTLRKRSWYSDKDWEEILNLKPGDIVTFWSDKNRQEKSVQVKITENNLIPAGSELTEEEISNLSNAEGWSIKWLEDNGFTKPSEDIINIRYKIL